MNKILILDPMSLLQICKDIENNNLEHRLNLFQEYPYYNILRENDDFRHLLMKLCELKIKLQQIAQNLNNMSFLRKLFNKNKYLDFKNERYATQVAYDEIYSKYEFVRRLTFENDEFKM